MARQPDIQTNLFLGDFTKTITLRALIAAAAMSAAVTAGPASAFDLGAFQEDLQGVAQDALEAGIEQNIRNSSRLGVSR